MVSGMGCDRKSLGAMSTIRFEVHTCMEKQCTLLLKSFAAPTVVTYYKTAMQALGIPNLVLRPPLAPHSPAPSTSGRCSQLLAPCATASRSSRGQRRSGRSRKPENRGFGRLVKQESVIPEEFDEIDAENEEEDELPSQREDFGLRSEYQVYRDPDVKPPRYVGDIELKKLEGRGRGVVAKTQLVPGDLLVFAPALGCLEGEWQSAPTPEDLHAAMMEAGLRPAQRRVIDMLYDGTEASTSKAASLPTLDAKFWSSRGKSDSQAPQISSSHLLSVIKECVCMDTQQDGAVMTLRHQKPLGFVGLWPEYSMLNHSCAPNTSILVVRERMLVHAAQEVEAGEELTRSYIGPAIMKPEPQRQATLKEMGYEWRCNCPRCTLESRVSPELQEVLQAAHAWYSEDATPRFTSAQSSEDLGALKELLEEASTIINEIDEAVDGEPGLSDIERSWLRASAYDCYDMLVLCDEFVNQEKAAPAHLLACLELLFVLAPGSESHTLLALKYEARMRQRAEMMEAVIKQGQLPANKVTRASLKEMVRDAEQAQVYKAHAMIARYGMVNLEMMEALGEATEVFTEAVEQMSIMEAQGQQETTLDYEIEGVKVSVVDKVDLGVGMPGTYQAVEASGQHTSEEVVVEKEGMQVSLLHVEKEDPQV